MDYQLSKGDTEDTVANGKYSRTCISGIDTN